MKLMANILVVLFISSILFISIKKVLKSKKNGSGVCGGCKYKDNCKKDKCD